MQFRFTVQDSATSKIAQVLPFAIQQEIDVAIKNTIEAIKKTVQQEYSTGAGKGFTSRTGRLRGSITTWIEEQGDNTVGIVSAGTEYDVYVEMLWGGRYAYMLPALMDNQRTLLNEITQAAVRAVTRL